jgi:hypothetical protein
MIRQRPFTLKTSSDTIVESEFGDVICNSGGAMTFIMPDPLPGLWYRFINYNTGVISIEDSMMPIVTLSAYESVLMLANNTDYWYYSKTSEKMTKAEIEAVFTGAITSHTHNYAPAPIIDPDPPTLATEGSLGQLYIETTTPTIYYLSAIDGEDYTWTELVGGGEGEAGLVSINPNHIFADTSERDTYFATNPDELVAGIFISVDDGFQQWDGSIWLDKTAVLQGTMGVDGAPGVGVPAGGTTGQALVKNSNTDYDTEWATIPTPPTKTGDGTQEKYTGTLSASGASYSGVCAIIEFLQDTWVDTLEYYMGSATDNNATIIIRDLGGRVIDKITGVTLTNAAWNTISLSTPTLFKTNEYYAISILYSVGSKSLYRNASLYSGTMWRMIQNRVNSFWGTAYSETPGIGFTEYNTV